MNRDERIARAMIPSPSKYHEWLEWADHDPEGAFLEIAKKVVAMEEEDLRQAKAEIEQLRSLVAELSGSLEPYIENMWRYREEYPDRERKYQRDMGVIYRARAALAETEPKT